MAPVAPPSGTVTFVFTDVVGSTRLWERDREAMAWALERHDAVVRLVTGDAGGHVFATAGDSFSVAFADAASALRAAVEIRDRLEEADWNSDGAIGVRIGLYTGAAVERGGDYFGPPVNRCARIMSLAGAGDVLVGEPTAALVEHVGLIDLGVHELTGVDAPQQVFSVRRRDGEVPVIDALVRPGLGEPGPEVRELIGRDHELAELRHLLRRHRVVTLVGPGGVGKTSLAGRLAGDLHAEVGESVLWCDLASVNEDGLTAAVAAVIGLTVESPGPADVVASLRHRRALLVLDNCEHVIDVAADLVVALKACPHLTMLCTSREALQVRDERVFPVAPLEPDAATALFVERAAPAGAETRLNSADVARLCQRLEGLPLAIELAASQLAVMTITDLDERLADRLRVLRTTTRDVPDRHRTLRDSIAWSWDLLDAGARSVLAMSATFVGGFSLTIAQDLGAGLGLDRFAVQESLDTLARHSLVALSSGVDGRARYRLLDSIRSFGLERLDLAGDRRRVESAFVDAMRRTSARIGEQMCSPEEGLGLRRCFEELANLRTAVDHAAEHDAGVDRVFDLALPVAPGGVTSSHSTEPSAWLRLALERWPSTEHPATGAAMVTVGVASLIRGDRERARALIETGRRRDQRPSAAGYRFGSGAALALLEWAFGNYARALQLARLAVEETRPEGPTQAAAGSLVLLLNYIGADDADFENVRRESQRVAENTGVPSLIAAHHLSAGNSLTAARRFDEAASELGLARRIAEADGLPIVNVIRRDQVLHYAVRAHARSAADHALAALDGLLGAGSIYTAWITVRLATTTIAQAGRSWEAIALDAACLASPVATRRLRLEREIWEPLARSAAEALGDRYEAAGAAGRAMTEDETWALALNVLQEIRDGRTGEGRGPS